MRFNLTSICGELGPPPPVLLPVCDDKALGGVEDAGMVMMMMVVMSLSSCSLKDKVLWRRGSDSDSLGLQKPSQKR